MEEAMNGPLKKEAPKEDIKPKKEKSAKPKVPSISEIPATAANTDGGEFASVDSLTGIEYENALAKMSDAQRERYLKA